MLTRADVVFFLSRHENRVGFGEADLLVKQVGQKSDGAQWPSKS